MIDSNKEAVKLRKKKLANGNESLYLDIYVEGRRKYEYLKLYLLPGRENKTKNKETLALANAVKAKRLVEIQNGRFGFNRKEKVLLLDFLSDYIEGKRENKSEGYVSGLETAVKHVRTYVGKKVVYVSEVDKSWCKGFVNHLKKIKSKCGMPLEQSTMHQYYTVMVVAFNKAVELELIDRNPFDAVADDEKPGRGKTNREYLTFDEVKELMNTDIKDIRIKRAFLFSCFTGLRYSDIVALKWKNVKDLGDGNIQLEFIQKKTKNQVVVPLNSNALQWMPERKCDEQEVFELPFYSVVLIKLRKWVKGSSITKDVTFHVARHTYATMLLYYGADLYTVSKLLGHSSVQITQIYAKVMDETKRKAVNLIPQIL